MGDRRKHGRKHGRKRGRKNKTKTDQKQIRNRTGSEQKQNRNRTDTDRPTGPLISTNRHYAHCHSEVLIMKQKVPFLVFKKALRRAGFFYALRIESCRSRKMLKKMSIWTQKLASIQKRASVLKFEVIHSVYSVHS